MTPDSGSDSLGRVPAWPAAEERYRYVRSVLARESPPPADLVDLGAAPGAQSIALARAGYRVIRSRSRCPGAPPVGVRDDLIGFPSSPRAAA